MARKTSDPMWAVRGVNSEEDVTLVIEAGKQIQAECFATKRGIEVVFVGEASSVEIEKAKTEGRLWRYTPAPTLVCLGRPVGIMQAGLLVICGLATMVLNLKANHVPLSLQW